MSRLLMEQGLRATRENRALHKYQATQKVTASFAVEVHADIYYDIPEGKQVIINHFHVGCDDTSEFAAAYLVSCSAVTGGGNSTQISHELHDHVGTAKVAGSHVRERLDPPLCVKYSSGARSVSMALKATDTDTVVKFGWCGWVEDEGTLS